MERGHYWRFWKNQENQEYSKEMSVVRKARSHDSGSCLGSELLEAISYTRRIQVLILSMSGD